MSFGRQAVDRDPNRRAGLDRSGQRQADQSAGADSRGVSVTAGRVVADDEAGVDAIAVIRIKMDFYRGA